MEVGLSATLLVLFVLQALLSLILMGPRFVSRPIIKILRGSTASTPTSAICQTVGVGLLIVAAANLFDLYGRSIRQGHADVQRTMMEALDMHRVWLATVLSVVNTLLVFFNRSFAIEAYEYDRSQLNLQALKRQVEGLATEYNRVSSAQDKSGENSDSFDEASRLKKQVTNLLSEKQRLQEQLDACKDAADAAQKDVKAMQAQSQNLAREFDRVVDQNLVLERKLEQLGGGSVGGGKKLL